jgi:hypothetical protein
MSARNPANNSFGQKHVRLNADILDNAVLQLLLAGRIGREEPRAVKTLGSKALYPSA